jgi:two-component system KDP operon response regulator KdpE
LQAYAPTILLAEDDETLRHEVGKFLEGHGYRLICAEDGSQAFEYALKDRPDLLILDVHMPAGDGFSVLDRVQHHPELALTPVIFMTRDPSTEIVADALDHDAVALLHKPFEMSDLLAFVRATLRSGGAEAA